MRSMDRIWQIKQRVIQANSGKGDITLLQKLDLQRFLSFMMNEDHCSVMEMKNLPLFVVNM